MFKQIFENKIGEKLNTFNNSGKAAFEWMDKFRQSLDITEKIQQQFNSTINGVNSSSANSVNNVGVAGANFKSHSNGTSNGRLQDSDESLNAINPNHSQAPASERQLIHTKKNRPLKEADSYDDSLLYNQQQHQTPSVTPNHNMNLSPNNSIKVNKKKLAATSHQNSSGSTGPNECDDYYLQSSSPNSLSQASSSNFNNSSSASSGEPQLLHQYSNTSNHTQHLYHQSKSMADDSNELSENEADANDDSNWRNGKGNNNNSSSPNVASARRLVRQSTDLTTSFPLKPFQKINSETVEIPGLNVKVVRYRIANDLGKIEPHLYTKYNLGVEANAAVTKGKLHFFLRYNQETQSFLVTIHRAEILNNLKQTSSTTDGGGSGGGGGGRGAGSLLNLSVTSSVPNSAPNSPNLNRPDTYVKIQLLPDKKRKFQTRIQRKSLTPVFDETFFFQMPIEDLKDRTLYLALFEFGRFSKHELIGSVRVTDLNLINHLNGSDVEFVRNLLPLADDDLELGELTLTLCYLPAAGRLTVTVVKAINLKAMDINGKSDPYVKVTLVSKGKRFKKKKTSVMKNTLHPIFNESMLFDIPQDQIETVDMVVKVIDYDRVGANELIGCIGIGPSFSGIGRDHWYRMLENPRKPITQSYYLKDSNFLREGLPSKVERALHSDRQESLESRGSDQ